MKTVDVNEVQTNFSYWLDCAVRGEEIAVTREGTMVVKLVGCQELSGARVPGYWAGQVQMADDFDELPEDIARAFEGEMP